MVPTFPGSCSASRTTRRARSGSSRSGRRRSGISAMARTPWGESVSAAPANSRSPTSASSTPLRRARSSSAVPRGAAASCGATRRPRTPTGESSSSSTARTPSATKSLWRSRARRRLRSRAKVSNFKALGTDPHGMALAHRHGVRTRPGDTMKRQLAGLALAVTLTGCGVSTQQEIEMGGQYAQQINAQLPIINDPEANRYINLLGDSIARLTSRTDIPDWKFFIVDSREVNAFAVPGGYVYVNRGLIERTQRMDQLAGVLGHEIGHVVKRHSIKQMQQAQGANVGVTLACVLTRICESQAGQAAIQVGGTALFAKFSRSDENVARAGINPNGIPEMFQILLNERASNPSAVEGWFATHPLEEDRITNTRAMIAQINPSVLRTLSTDSQRYQSFKARIRSLPPSPTPRAAR